MSKIVSLDYKYNMEYLDNKLYSLQFLPEIIKDLTNSKEFIFNNKTLKTNYIVDIIHNLLLKYYFKKDNNFILNAEVLKDKYGFLYNYYINYLLYNNIIVLVKNYKIGYKSRTYSLNDKIFNDKIYRYKNHDKVLVKKFKAKFIDISSYNEWIDIDVKEKLIDDLFSINIDQDRAIFFLDSLKDKNVDIYNRNVYSVECINNKHIFYHFDDYGRMHTNFTILRSFIRKNCLYIDNDEVCELDINNSQVLFLAKLIVDSDSKWVEQNELNMFKELVINGRFYDYLIFKSGISDRKEVKNLVYKVLFGRNNGNSKSDKLFKSLFPTIHNFIKLYKMENNNYKTLSYELQRMESDVIFNKIIKNIMLLDNSIKIITVHDSIIFQSKHKKIVTNIFNNELAKVIGDIV